MLHDIGKLGIPAEILSKPTALSKIEFELIRTHPQTAYEILADIAFPGPVAEIVLQHHERQDGSGYPKKISGDDILPEARILAVADVVEAMASHRPYRPALGIDAALTEIRAGSGRRYDQQIVDACVALFESGEFSFQPASAD
jgi:HD-GYP domain-containing protein (c-di-GMP phosphodiesterase class II)